MTTATQKKPHAIDATEATNDIDAFDALFENLDARQKTTGTPSPLEALTDEQRARFIIF